MLVRTRFAPSPTGYLHIGGVRTAIFNWLYARQHGGQFLLRIDDTDTNRNIEEVVKPIMEGLTWLGLHWNEKTIYQSKRQQRYWDIVQELLDQGHAYPDDTPVAQIEEQQRLARQSNKSFIYRGARRAYSPGFNKSLADMEKGKCCIRLALPTKGNLVVNDLVHGKLTWDWQTLSDPVIVRADGTPLYNLATVVDDHLMEITDIIRAEEHLSNTPIQWAIYQAMRWSPPNVAHVPFVCAPGSRKKLSKRDLKKFVTPQIVENLKSIGFTEEDIENRDDLNPAALSYYKEMGYLPQAVFNYLARLGWALDDKTEKMTLDQMLTNFTFKGVSSSPASFDPQKLYWLQGQYMKEAAADQKTGEAMIYLNRAGAIADYSAAKPSVRRLVEVCGDRIKVFSDVIQYGAFFFRKPVYQLSVAKEVMSVLPLTQALTIYIAFNGEWLHDPLEKALRDHAATNNKKLADYVHSIRYALTGQRIGPSLFHCMELLGQTETLLRLKAGLELAETLEIPY